MEAPGETDVWGNLGPPGATPQSVGTPCAQSWCIRTRAEPGCTESSPGHQSRSSGDPKVTRLGRGTALSPPAPSSTPPGEFASQGASLHGPASPSRGEGSPRPCVCTHHTLLPDHGHALLHAVGALGDKREVVPADSLLGGGEGTVGAAGHLEVPAAESRGHRGPGGLSSLSTPTPCPATRQRVPTGRGQEVGRAPWTGGPGDSFLDSRVGPRGSLPGEQGGEVVRGAGVRVDGGRRDEGSRLGPVLAPVVRAVRTQASGDGLPEHHHPCSEV